MMPSSVSLELQFSKRKHFVVTNMSDVMFGRQLLLKTNVKLIGCCVCHTDA